MTQRHKFLHSEQTSQQPQGIIYALNAAAQSQFQYSAEEMLGQTFDFLCPTSHKTWNVCVDYDDEGASELHENRRTLLAMYE